MKKIYSFYCTVRRKTLFLIALIAFFISVAASANARDVLVVKSSSIKPYQEALDGFKSSCGCSIIEEITSQGRNHGSVKKEIEGRKPDVILAVGIDALRIARDIEGIPVVSVMAPLGSSPEFRNISGVNMLIEPVFQLTAMLDLLPEVKRIGVLGTSGALEAHQADLGGYARSRGVTIIAKRVNKAGDVSALLEELKGKVDLLWMIPDTKVMSEENIRSMMLFSFQNKVPIFSFSKKYVEMGATATLYVDAYDMGAQAGDILKDGEYAKKGGSPVRMTARTPRLIVNKKIVKKMGLRANEAVLGRADDVE